MTRKVIQRALKPSLIFYISFLLLFKPLYGEETEPHSFWLSWLRLPTETMTIRWLTDENPRLNTIEFREKGGNVWTRASSHNLHLPNKLPFVVHGVELTGLIADTSYEFRFHSEGKVHFFHTMPKSLDKSLRFVDGGDMYHDDIECLKETLRQAAKTDPDFVIAGGDLAYAAPALGIFSEDIKRWLTFLSAWQETMRAEDGRIIPMVPVIGNHEVIGRYGQTPKEAEFFYSFFVFPRKSASYVLDFGNYMTLLILDSGHTENIEGRQTEWLQKTLNDRARFPHKFASYHIPAFPSVRKLDGKISTKIRKNWVPFFESAPLNAAFEHHDHAYKRTFPLFQGKIDQEKGIIYLGDGAFGIKEPRAPQDLSVKWYLEKAIPVRHFILVTLRGNKRLYEAIDYKGNVVDKLLQ